MENSYAVGVCYAQLSPPLLLRSHKRTKLNPHWQTFCVPSFVLPRREYFAFYLSIIVVSLLARAKPWLPARAGLIHAINYKSINARAESGTKGCPNYNNDSLSLENSTSPTSCMNSGHSATQRGGAAGGAERPKRLAYADWIDPAVQSFMPLALEMSGRWGSLPSKFFDLVKRTAVERRGYSGLRYQHWAGYWHRAISVGLLRDIAKSALRICDQLVIHQPIATSFFTDLGHS